MREASNNGMIGVVVVGEARMEVASIMEDLKGEVKVLLACEHGDQALRVEALGPRLDRGSDAIRGLGA